MGWARWDDFFPGYWMLSPTNLHFFPVVTSDSWTGWFLSPKKTKCNSDKTVPRNLVHLLSHKGLCLQSLFPDYPCPRQKWFMNTFSASRHWKTHQRAREAKSNDGKTFSGAIKLLRLYRCHPEYVVMNQLVIRQANIISNELLQFKSIAPYHRLFSVQYDMKYILQTREELGVEFPIFLDLDF